MNTYQNLQLLTTIYFFLILLSPLNCQSVLNFYYHIEYGSGTISLNPSDESPITLKESLENPTECNSGFFKSFNPSFQSLSLEIFGDNKHSTFGIALCFFLNSKSSCLGWSSDISFIGLDNSKSSQAKTIRIPEQSYFEMPFFSFEVDPKSTESYSIKFYADNESKKIPISCINENSLIKIGINENYEIIFSNHIKNPDDTQDINSFLFYNLKTISCSNEFSESESCENFGNFKIIVKNDDGSFTYKSFISFDEEKSFSIKKNFLINPLNKGKVSINFQLSNLNVFDGSEEICTIEIQSQEMCKNCNDCFFINSYSSYKCIECKENYYLLPSSADCYKEEEIPLGYYLDKSIENDYQIIKCDDSCKECNGKFNNNCISCDGINYFIIDDPVYKGQCIEKNNVPSNFYFNGNEYSKCFEKCLTCLGKGDINNNNCLSCDKDKDFYFNKDNNNCIKLTEVNEGFFYDKEKQIIIKCNNRCSKCDLYGDDSNSNCLSCNNLNEYHFHPINNNHCILVSELDSKNYYLDKEQDKFIKCDYSCLTCNGPNNNQCLSCDGKNFYKIEKKDNYCLTKEQIPENYYLVSIDKINDNKENYNYKECYPPCKTCSKGGNETNNNCDSCFTELGYELNENKNCIINIDVPEGYYYNGTDLNKCFDTCKTCLKGGNDLINNCLSCITNTYFQNYTSTNCIKMPDKGFYIETYDGKEILFPCYLSCSTCLSNGTKDNNNCLSCKEEYIFNKKTNNCKEEDDKTCGIGCSSCFHESPDPIYGILSADKMCKKCSQDKGYFPLEKYSSKQYYVNCYPRNTSLTNYIFDENSLEFKICYVSCSSCYKVGNSTHHCCLECSPGFIFSEEQPNNCFGECKFYHYTNVYGQYKCTQKDECPSESPYLIKDKLKCTENCYEDNEYNIMYLDECLKKCPEGMEVYVYIYNGKKTAKCINKGEKIFEDCQVKNHEDDAVLHEDLTLEILNQYAEEYIHDNPVSDSFVYVYKSPSSDETQYLNVIYKQVKCAKEKVQGFIDLGITECVEKVRQSFRIVSKIVVQTNLVVKTGSTPQVSFTLYHPDTAEILDVSICKETKIAIKTNILDNEGVDEELVKYFSKLGINLFNIEDPFFSDICFHFDFENKKDVTLDDRIDLYFQNVSLCENGCSYVGINLTTFEVECSCVVENTTNTTFTESLLSSDLTDKIFNSLTDTNINVLLCFKDIFNGHIFIKNKGGIIILAFIIAQIIASIFVRIQLNKVRLYLYKDVLKERSPPRKNNKNFEDEGGDKENNNNDFKIKGNILNNYNNRNRLNKNNKGNKKVAIKKIKNNLISSSNLLVKNGDSISNNNNNIFNSKDQESINNFFLGNQSINKKKSQENINNNSSNNNNNLNNLNLNHLNTKNNIIININNMEIDNIKSNKRKKSSKIIKINNLETDGEKNDKNNYEKNLCFNEERYLQNNNQDFEFKEKIKNLRNFQVKDENDLEILSQYQRSTENKKENENESEDKKEKENKFTDPQDERVNQIKQGKLKYCKEKIKVNKNNFLNNKEISFFNIININNTTNKSNNNNNKNNNKNTNKTIIYSRNSPKEEININKKNNENKNKDDNSNNNSNKNKNINILKNQIRGQVLKELEKEKEEAEAKEKEQKEKYVSPENKKYANDELEELDFDEAVLFDNRGFCRFFLNQLLERQQIINTFFVCEKLKPFSMKLIVFIFSTTCYFVVNCFLYDAKYVSNLLKKTGDSTAFEFLTDSLDRVLYTSFIGGVINIIIGVLFHAEKKIHIILVKMKDNKTLLKGEIARNFRITKKIFIVFIVVNFILMTFSWIYIYCFCSVYPNSQLDWIESSCFVLGIMQFLPVLIGFSLALLRYIGIKKQNYIIFQIYTWISTSV